MDQNGAQLRWFSPELTAKDINLLGGVNVMSEKKKYRVGVVGCGRIAGSIDDEVPPDFPYLPYCHAGSYAAVENTEVVAAADPVEEKLETFCKRWEVPGRYKDYREMIEKEKPDIVSVCTRQNLHAEVTIFSAHHGVKGVYCEKAMASSMAEADAMVSALEENGVAFNLGVQRRFAGQFRTARKLIADGELGEVKCIIFTGNTLLMETNSHSFDTLCFLIGDPKAKRFAGEVLPGSNKTAPEKKIDYDPIANRWDADPLGRWAFMEFEDDITAQMVSPAGANLYEWHIFGSEGILHLVDRVDSIWRKGSRDKKRVPFPEYTESSPSVEIVKDLVHGVETGEPTQGNARVSRAVTELILAWAESHTRGGTSVPLPLRNRSLYINRP